MSENLDDDDVLRLGYFLAIRLAQAPSSYYSVGG